MRRKKTQDYTWAEKQRIIEDMEHRGLSAASVAERVGRCVSTIFNWQRALHEQRQQTEAFVPVVIAASDHDFDAQTMPMESQKVPHAAEKSGFLLEHSSGWRMSFAELPAAAWLKELLELGR